MLTIPATQRAVAIPQQGAAPTMIGQSLPEPGPGQVWVKMAYAPINPADLAFVRGEYGIKKPYPAIPGLEGSGVVVKAGKGLLPRLWNGRRVACASSPKFGGTWSEYMLTDATRCVPLSASVSLQQGAMLFVNPLTVMAFRTIIRRGKHQAIVHTAAASALGKMLLRLCIEDGVEVIAVVRREAQVTQLKAIGAKYVVNTAEPDYPSQLKTYTHELKATLALDAVSGEMTEILFKGMPAKSEIMVYGRLSGAPSIIPPGSLIFDQKKISGFWLSHWIGQKSFLQSVQDTRIIQQRLTSSMETQIQAIFPMDQVVTAIDTYTTGMSQGKVLLQMHDLES